MKTLVLLLLSLTVALGVPVPPPGVEQNPILTKEEQSPLLGDVVPVQGHVEVEVPAPQPQLSHEKQEKEESVVKVEGNLKEDQEQKEKPEPEVKEEQKIQAEEVKQEFVVDVKEEVKEEQEQKEQPEPEVKVEQELKAEEPEDKQESVVEESGVKEEVKEEQEQKEQPESEIKVEQEIQAEEPEVEQESMVEEDSNVVQVNTETEEQELITEPEVEVEQEVEVMGWPGIEVEVEEEFKEDPYIEVEPEPEVGMEPRFSDNPDFRMVESEVQAEQELEEATKLNDIQEEFQVEMKLEEESEPGLAAEEMPEGLVRQQEVFGGPTFELEPLKDEEPSEAEMADMEKTLKAAFQGQNLVDGPEGENDEMRRFNYVSDEEPIMELEPVMMDEPFPNQYSLEDAAVFDEGPALDLFGQPMSFSENDFPNEEESLMGEEFQNTEENELQRVQDMQGGRSCPGEVYEGKCYQFFREPKKASDAEFFCQNQFPNGHLASITSQSIHRRLMSMMLQEIGSYTRTWVGGLRYLDTGRFIWLDGSRWSYSDWLQGEPNHTAGKEHCLEILSFGSGKFNDFTCWEPQAFICSYPYQ